MGEIKMRQAQEAAQDAVSPPLPQMSAVPPAPSTPATLPPGRGSLGSLPAAEPPVSQQAGFQTKEMTLVLKSGQAAEIKMEIRQGAKAASGEFRDIKRVM